MLSDNCIIELTDWLTDWLTSKYKDLHQTEGDWCWFCCKDGYIWLWQSCCRFVVKLLIHDNEAGGVCNISWRRKNTGWMSFAPAATMDYIRMMETEFFKNHKIKLEKITTEHVLMQGFAELSIESKFWILEKDFKLEVLI